MTIIARWREVWRGVAILRAVDEDAGATAESAMAPAMATLDDARQQKAHRYARQRQTLMLLNLGISAVVIAVLLLANRAAHRRRRRC